MFCDLFDGKCGKEGDVVIPLSGAQCTERNEAQKVKGFSYLKILKIPKNPGVYGVGGGTTGVTIL